MLRYGFQPSVSGFLQKHVFCLVLLTMAPLVFPLMEAHGLGSAVSEKSVRRVEETNRVTSPATPVAPNAAPPHSTDVSGPTFLVRVPLPITGSVDLQIKQTLENILQQSANDGPRPTVVLEFSQEETGQGSEFERSLALARFLTSNRAGRLRTVAYVQKSVYGHTLLVVCACEQIVAHPDAELGDAGRHETAIDVTMRSGYREIASRRMTVPIAVALGMLDSQLSLTKVQTATGVRYVLKDELASLQQSGLILEAISIGQANRPLVFSGKQMRVEHGFVSHLAKTRQDLAEALGINFNDLRTPWTARRPQQPLLVDVPDATRATARRVRRIVEQERQRRPVDWLCLHITSNGGFPVESADLARYIADLSRQDIYTVAYVSVESRADAALPALMCDQLIAHPTAIIGGNGPVSLRQPEINAALDVMRELSREKQRRWSFAAAVMDPQQPLARYVHSTTGATEYLCHEEWNSLEQHEQWQRQDGDVSPEGTVLEITGATALSWGIAQVVQSSDELAALFGIKQPLVSPTPNWADELITALAAPRVSAILLFIAMFCLMGEFASPGLGIGGFLSSVCFALYFWSNFLNGTAGWLEVVLFVVGLCFLLLEVFVLPGFGVFGLGGIGLILLSLVLASQTFVLPHNQYELDQLPRSLWTFAVLFAGLIAGIVTLRHYLKHIPGLNEIILRPPNQDESTELAHTDSRIGYDYLLGERGTATTRLTPSGKANFGHRWFDVLSEGDVVEPGEAVRVISVTGNCIVVRPVVKPPDQRPADVPSR
ncbi:MAG: hypothetical protein O2931_07080 [Planctomycetota bacterium]|nr:hypothetical protein [Planctomycetota bacterium]MDA1178543.1 hypothetical protein [Planctomycetota bacterium]